MIRRLALGLLLVLAGCNRSGVADVTLDADAAQRNATATKTRDDLAAATSASRGPAPVVRDADPVNSSDNSADEARDETREAGNAASPDNQAAPLANDAAELNSTNP